MKLFSLPIRFGIATSGSLIAYFLVLSLFGLHTNVFYSLFNGVITGFGIYEAIKYYRLELGKKFDYAKGFTAGIVTGFLATLIFTLFFAVYSTEFNPEFLQELSTKWFNEFRNFEGIVFFTVAIMGFATTLVLTLSFMQLFKTSNNPRKKAV
jgi:predicted membrane metal-binding protein